VRRRGGRVTRARLDRTRREHAPARTTRLADGGAPFAGQRDDDAGAVGAAQGLQFDLIPVGSITACNFLGPAARSDRRLRVPAELELIRARR
jgi:hypothetical protein